MRIFDTYVQKLKYKVLTELARQTWVGNDAFSVFNDIANQVVKKGEPTMSCCIYKDRAIVAERIRIALGGKKEDHNVIQVIDIACDECPVAGHVVTDLCRGCVAHACVDACKLGAITVDSHQKAEIDKSKCVECGKCAKSCPYSAIANFKRPCERACKVDAISMAPDGVSFMMCAEKIQSDLAEAGVTMKIDSQEVSVYLEGYRDGTQQAVVSQWGPDYFDSNNQLAFMPGNTVGLRAGWALEAAPELAELGAQAAVETDDAAREQLFLDIQDQMDEVAAPYIVFLQAGRTWAVNSRVQNINPSAAYMLDLATLQVAE